MNIDEILSRLQRNEGHFAKDAVLEAIAHRDEVIPALLDALRDVVKNPEPYIVDQGRFLHLYAMYLLAQFREDRAYPLLVQIFSLPGRMPFQVAGDTVTTRLEGILASVSNGDVSGMTALIENEEANPYVRSAAMDGLLTLVARGERTREEIVAYFSRLFHTLKRTPSYAWDGLACSCTDLWPGESIDDLRTAWEEGLISPGTIAWDEIDEWHARGKEACLQDLQQKFTLITDVVKEMEGWACFYKERKPTFRQKAVPGLPLAGSPKPIRRTGAKIGRNDPCPCGSGKKFKKCCGH